MRSVLCIAVCGLFLPTGVLAYKEYTHARISQVALARATVGQNPAILRELGLGSTTHDMAYPLPFFWESIPFPFQYTPAALVFQGAIDEDAGIRPFNHFLDPQQGGIGLTVAGSALGHPSPTWALESDGDVLFQDHSYRDAKRYLHSSFTGPSEGQRKRDLGSAFYTLGHVVHHLQDMAQPQHVRNDDHCDKTACKAFFAYKPSGYEEFTFERGLAIPLDGYATADYGSFQRPADFWQQGGAGIAEFTTNNFVSAATNFYFDFGYIEADDKHPQPTGTATFLEKRQITDPDLLGPVGPSQPLDGQIWFVGTPVVDHYGGTALNRRASTYSIFDPDLQEAGERSLFTLNRFNYITANEFLLPRATAYSTGLINYFFRGRIEITLPGEGVYGVIDHATTYATGQGFGKLKLKLRNASPDGVKPDGTRVPQTMQGGTLVAVAKYTLNSCYQPDLSGDYGARYDIGEIVEPVNCSFEQYLAGEEQISQSTAILAASLDPVTPGEFTFDFSSQPIPVNARDLRVQVVYTGTLGAEPDAIAFGGKDISEPTHLVIYNSSDYFAVDGKLYTPAQIRSDPALSQRVAGLNIDPRPLTGLAMAVVPGKPIAGSSGAVPVNGYVRVAVLADADQPISLSVLSRFEGTGFSEATFPRVWPAVIDLRSPEGYITPYGIFRGPRGSFFDVLFKANSSAPLASGELVSLSGRMVADPGPTAIPVRF